MSIAASTETLRSRILKAGFWVIGGSGVMQLFRLVNNLILARLLMPEMFGMMAIVNSVLVGLVMFSDLGFHVYIIQNKRGDNPDLLNPIWSITIVRGFLLWFVALLLCFGLYLAGQYGWVKENTTYAEPILPFALAVASLATVIFGFQSTKVATATRHLAQKKLFLMELYSQLPGLAVMIIWALIDRSIWALVAGSLVTVLTSTILSHTMLPGMSNRWQWSWPVFWKVLNFGQWIFLSSALSFLFSNGDRLLLGGLLTAGTLGLYTIAFMMVNAIHGAFDKINSEVAFPSISEVYREDQYRLKEIYYKFRYRLDPLIILAAALLLTLGDDLIDALYDDRYAGARPMLQLLSLLLIVQIYELADQCFLAIGKPKVLSLLNAIRTASLFTLVPVGYTLIGMEGAIWGIILSYFSAVPTSMILMARRGVFDLKWELIVLAVWIGIFVGAYAAKLIT